MHLSCEVGGYVYSIIVDEYAGCADANVRRPHPCESLQLCRHGPTSGHLMGRRIETAFLEPCSLEAAWISLFSWVSTGGA